MILYADGMKTRAKRFREKLNRASLSIFIYCNYCFYTRDFCSSFRAGGYLRDNAATCRRSKGLFKIHSSFAPANGGISVMPSGAVL